MKTMMNPMMQMRCCCMRMMHNENENQVHINKLYKEQQEYEEEHFYDSITLRAAA